MQLNFKKVCYWPCHLISCYVDFLQPECPIVHTIPAAPLVLDEEGLELLRVKLSDRGFQCDQQTLRQDLMKPQLMYEKGRYYSVKILNAVIAALPSHTVLSSVRGNWTKLKKINAIADALGVDRAIAAPRGKRCSPPSLRQLAKDVLGRRSYPKDVLNVILAQYEFPQAYFEWKSQQLIDDSTNVEGMTKPEFWYSYPEYNPERGQIEPKNVDPSHLLTNGRVKVTKDGAHGVSKEAFRKVCFKWL